MDKIVSTPMPLSYTRHTTRSLLVYLFAIPFALWPSAGWLTPVILFFISIILLGIEECGVQIEEPFAILPLVKCHKWLLFEVRRMRGLVELPDEERRGRGSRKRREEEVDSSE